MKAIVIIVSVLSFVVLFATVQTIDNSNLISLVAVYRHGARTPKQFYTNDPYNFSNFKPVGKEQLTNEGKNQHYALGQWLRSRYDGWLPETYSVNDIYVQSTDYDRTLMSAQCNLAGLYPPKGDQQWNESFPLWQPIPIHTVPKKQDSVLAGKQSCTKFDALGAEVEENDFFKTIYTSYKDVFEYLSNYTGDKIKTLKDVKALYDTLYIEKEQFNLSLPEWTASIYPDTLDFLAGYSFIQDTYTTDLARLKIGRFYRTIYKHFKAIDDAEEEEPKFLMYSAHESTLANILNAIGAFDLKRPPYASMVIFEQRLNEDGDSSYINIYYKKDDVLTPITVSGCKYNCKRKNFKKILDDVIIKSADWEEECAEDGISTRFTNYKYDESNDVEDGNVFSRKADILL